MTNPDFSPQHRISDLSPGSGPRQLRKINNSKRTVKLLVQVKDRDNF